MKRKSTKTYEFQSLKRLLLVLFGLIGLVIIYLLFVYPRSLESPTFVDDPTSEETETLEGLSRFLGTVVSPTDYNYADWVEQSGVRVPLTGKQIALGTSDMSKSVGKYGSFTTDELENVNAEFLTTLQDKTSEYFQSNGFSPNELNTNLVPNDLYFSTLGYQKDNLYCLANFALMSDPFGYISCGTVDQKQLGLQKEFSNIYDEQKSQNYGDIPITFRVTDVDGDFANGSVSSLGGYQWIAKKTDGVWTTIWAGQDFPLCSDMATYEVPNSMYPGCYNPQTEEVQKKY